MFENPMEPCSVKNGLCSLENANQLCHKQNYHIASDSVVIFLLEGTVGRVWPKHFRNVSHKFVSKDSNSYALHGF